MKREIKPFEFYTKEIEEKFDFERVHKAMIAVGWSWYMGMSRDCENYGTPTITTIKNHAYQLLEDAYKLKSGSVNSGGFSAGWEGDNMYLSFILEDFTTS